MLVTPIEKYSICVSYRDLCAMKTVPTTGSSQIRRERELIQERCEIIKQKPFRSTGTDHATFPMLGTEFNDPLKSFIVSQ
jgi:hypothetical protein